MATQARKKHRFALMMLATTLASACATVANTHTARPISADGATSGNPNASGMTVSGEELEEVSSPHFGVIAVTFENPTSGWVQIDDVQLDFGSDAKNQNVFIPWGEQITSWELATSQRIAIRRVNTENVLGMLAIGGAVAAGLGRRSAVGAVGGLVALGSMGALWAQAVNNNTTAAMLPPAHLLATPFSVPPGLFAKKWVLLNSVSTSAGGCIGSVKIDYTVNGKGRERVWLPFSRGGSEWQGSTCRGG